MPCETLFLASTYAFNESGVQDIHRLVESLDATLRTTYLSTNHVFVVDGDIGKEKSEACIALFREYLEKHAHENLLDVPPIRPLDSFHFHNTISRRSTTKGPTVEALLDLEENVATPAARFTQTWEPSIENDYFATDQWGVLPRLALEHDVDISVETLTDAKLKLRVSGAMQSNIKVAVERLAVSETPLSFVRRPYRGLIFITPHDEPYSFSIVRYSSINRTALRRVLVSLGSPTTGDLPGMLAPVLCCNNIIVSNIEKPTHVQPTSENIHAWRDYRFPEVGNGDLYTHLAASRRGLSRPSAPESSSAHGSLPSTRVPPVENKNSAASNLARSSFGRREKIEAGPEHDHGSQLGLITIPSPAARSLSLVGGESVSQKLPPGIKTRKVLVRAKESSGTNPSPSVPPKVKEPPVLPAGKSTIEPSKVQQKGETSISVSKDTSVITSRLEDSSATKRAGIQGENSPGIDSRKSTLPATDPLPPVVCETLSLIDMDDEPLVDDRPIPQIGVTSIGNYESRSLRPNFQLPPHEVFPSSGSVSPLTPASFQAPPDAKSSSTTGKENDTWARRFLLKEIQESSNASIWNDYFTKRPVNTRHQDSQPLIPESQESAEDEVKGEVHEQLATDDGTSRVLHSLMRNKAPRRRFFGWQKSQMPPSPTFRIEIVPQLVRNDSPRVSPGLQPELHKTKRILSEEQTQQIKSLFKSMKPLVESTSYYPGSLTLEFQLGLVLIPQPSQTLEGRYKDLEKLQSKLLPRSGLPAPSTVFFDRLTTSAADVDSIVDLEIHGVHLFAPEPTERETRLEFHCSTEAGDLIIVVYVDRDSKIAEVRAPSEMLGSVHISFPGQVWDAAVVIRGEMKPPLGINPEIEKRAQHIVNSLWVEPDQGRVRLFASIPKDKLSVTKVFVKRCTQYRHFTLQDSKMLGQDVFLQVVETQDLIVRRFDKDGVFEAYCALPDQMALEHRKWWQVSIVSPVVNSALKPTNYQLPGSPGWSVSDLLGSEKDLVSGETSISPGSPLACGDPARNSSATAASIGSAGIGSLLGLTQTVVESIDAVGFWNSCSGVLPAATRTSHDSPSSQPIKPPSRSKTPVQNTNRELVLRITKAHERGSSAEGFAADPTFW